jgi:hypothetical protein
MANTKDKVPSKYKAEYTYTISTSSEDSKPVDVRPLGPLLKQGNIGADDFKSFVETFAKP